MILGVGIDLCRVERIRRSLARFGKAWLDEVFTEYEQNQLGAGDQTSQLVATAFALKEACSKAIGTGFGEGVARRDFVVSFEQEGCSVRLTGEAAFRAVQLCSVGQTFSIQTIFRSETEWVSAAAMLVTGDTLPGTMKSLLDLPRLLDQGPSSTRRTLRISP